MHSFVVTVPWARKSRKVALAFVGGLGLLGWSALAESGPRVVPTENVNEARPGPDPGCGGDGYGCWPVCGCGNGCGCAAATRTAGVATPDDGAAFASSNMVLKSRISLQQFSAALGVNFNSGSDCWGYTSPSGREYAIMGLNSGFAFVEITNPSQPDIVGFVSKPSALWGDAAIIGQYAYLVSDSAGDGIRIANLSNIDNGVVTLAATRMPSGLRTVHSALAHNGVLYVSGSNLPSSGLVALSVTDPLNPVVVGNYSGTYCHDFQLHTYTSGPYAGKTIAFGFMGSAGMDVIDYTNTASPVRLSRTQYANLAYNHQGWLNSATNLLYVNDELDEMNNPNVTACLTRIFDVSNLASPQLVGSFATPNNVVDHNNYIRDGVLYQANYRAGVQLFDLRVGSGLNPQRIGWFDSYPGADAREFNGAWSVYPYFPSGTTIVSDIEGGLFVLDPTFALNGGVPLAFEFVGGGAPTEFSPHGQTIRVRIMGVNGGSISPTEAPTMHYRVNAGSFSSVMMTLEAGDVYKARLPATPCLGRVDYYFSARSLNGLTVPEPLSAPESYYSGLSVSDDVTTASDTLEANSGWVVGAPDDNASSGVWVRVDPVGTAAQPEDDHTPPPGVNAFVTGQGAAGGFLGEADVDGGKTTLTSPTFDATAGGGSGDAYVEYWRWYSNDQGSAPNQATDSMIVSISNNNGATWTLLEDVLENTGVWTKKSFRVADFVAPTNQLRLRFVARDLGSGSIVEAGVDDVRLNRLRCLPGGDANGDGLVNFTDLNLVLSNWGQAGAGVVGDLDGDEVVSFSDLNLVLSNFGAGA